MKLQMFNKYESTVTRPPTISTIIITTIVILTRTTLNNLLLFVVFNVFLFASMVVCSSFSI